jgi:hypothetical protein
MLFYGCSRRTTAGSIRRRMSAAFPMEDIITADTENARKLPVCLNGRALPTIVPQCGESWSIKSLFVGIRISLTNYGESFLTK